MQSSSKSIENSSVKLYVTLVIVGTVMPMILRYLELDVRPFLSV